MRTQRGCNAVVDITTRIMPMSGTREILMVGTGSYNPTLGRLEKPVTSELTGEELWNITQMGYEPVRLVLGTSVYALGIAGGISAMFSSMSRGEVKEVTHLVYEARENCLAHIHADAEDHDAEDVIGIKLFVNELGGGLIEVLAIGTAVRKNAALKTQSEQLLPQAIIRDRDTFFDETLSNLSREQSGRTKQLGQAGAQSNPVACLIALVLIGLFFVAPCLIGIIVAAFKGK